MLGNNIDRNDDDLFKSFVVYSLFLFGTFITVFINLEWLISEIQRLSAP